MLVADPREDVTTREVHLPVEGLGVPQPLSKIERKVRELKQQGGEIITQMRATDPQDMEQRAQLVSTLTSIQNNLTRWGVPLFAFMPYKYPPSTFSLND